MSEANAAPAGASRCATKQQSEFRNYTDSNRQDVVKRHYRDMRAGQTVEFVDRMHAKYSFCEGKFRAEMSIREAFLVLESYVDSSDPDVSLPNLVHMFQTAEAIRKDGHDDWFQLVGLIHDMGKIMFAIGGLKEDGQMGTADASQWGLGGDTWVVGCKIPDSVIFPEYNSLNPDESDPRFNTELGIYSEQCGLDSLKFAYGHDEYLYQMLVANECKLPPQGLAMIRFHSAYPWHNGGAYKQFMYGDKDEQALKWVLEFNKYDLYTKDENGISTSIDELWEYYQPIVDKYFPTKILRW